MASAVVGAIAGSTILGGLFSSRAQRSAASSAFGAQTAAAEAGLIAQREAIAESKRQFDEVKALLEPYVSAGTRAVGAQEDLLGLQGDEAQQAAIENIQAGPEFQAMTELGEEAILANASATGGLRGGNVQAALSKFRPQVLSDLINQRFQRLGGPATLGQASAAGQAAASGQQSAIAQQGATNIANLLGQQGAAAAGRALAVGQANANLYGGISDTVSNLAVLKALKVF